MYDPDKTGVGVQPYYYDQAISALLYNGWTVVASKITVYPHFLGDAGDLSAFQKIFLYPALTNVPLTYTDPSDLSNMRYSKQILVSLNTQSKDKGNKLSSYMSTRKMYPNIVSKDNTLAGTYSSDPNVMWYWHVMFDQTHDNVHDCYNTFDVKITYYAICRAQGNNINES